jgi:hypothetical protein
MALLTRRLRSLIDDVEQQAAADRYFYSITCYAYVGRKKLT